MTPTSGAARDRPVTSGAGEPSAGLSDQHLWSHTGVQGSQLRVPDCMAPCTTLVFFTSVLFACVSMALLSHLCTVQAFADLLANASKVSDATRCSYVSQA